MEKELVCIRCPLGCSLCVTWSDKTIVVSGNSCLKGKEYGINEVTNPVRVVTGTVSVSGGVMARVPVKTAEAVSKAAVLTVAREMRRVEITAPVKIGDVVVVNIADTGVNLVATRTVEALHKEECT